MISLQHRYNKTRPMRAIHYRDRYGQERRRYDRPMRQDVAGFFAGMADKILGAVGVTIVTGHDLHLAKKAAEREERARNLLAEQQLAQAALAERLAEPTLPLEADEVLVVDHQDEEVSVAERAGA